MGDNNYYTLEAGSTTLSSDSILSQYDKRGGMLEQLLETVPEQLTTEIGNVFPVDLYCQCQLGIKPRSTVTCLHCTQIRRLMDYRYIAPHTPFVISAGSHIGKELITIEYEKVGCSVKIKNTLVILDKFTLANLIHCYLYRKLQKVGFNTILPFYTAFICSTTGYTLVALSEPIDDVLMDDVSCQQALKQIATTLDYLTYANFHRRTPCADQWRVIRQPIAYTYKGVTVNSRFRVVLSDFSDSTIKVKDQWYTDYQSANIMVNRPLQNVDADTFRLTPSTIEEFHSQRGSGQWNNGSFLWCSYLIDLWSKMSCCSKLTELSKLFPTSTDSCFYQDLPQNALAASMEKMSKW